MGDFIVKVAPIARFQDGRWQTPIFLERAIGDKELFATVYGESKEIASMRAALVVAAINRGVGNNENADLRMRDEPRRDSHGAADA